MSKGKDEIEKKREIEEFDRMRWIVLQIKRKKYEGKTLKPWNLYYIYLRVFFQQCICGIFYLYYCPCICQCVCV